MTLPGTRKPRLLCTRAATTPVNARSPASAGCTAAISTSCGTVLGSCADCEGAQAVRFTIPAQTPVARASVLTRSIVVLPRVEIGLAIPTRSPSTAECSECTHRGSCSVGTRLREFVLGGEQLTIGVENIGQRDDASLVGLLRGISRTCQCGDLGEQLLVVSLELHQ